MNFIRSLLRNKRKEYEMRQIYRYDVMEKLAEGADVYALVFTEKKPIVEDAATISGRILARYMASNDVDWYVSEIEECEDDKTE